MRFRPSAAEISPRRAASWAARKGDDTAPNGAVASVTEVKQLRVALTVDDFDEALQFYRDSLGLEQVVDWSSDSGRVVLLDAGRATLELFDEAQAANVDLIEVGRRVSGPVRFAFEVADSESTADRLVAAGAEQVAPVVTPPWGGWNVRLETPHRMQPTLFSSAE